MKTRKGLIIISIIFIISILLTVFVGCKENQETGIRYNDKVEGRYSDGMKILDFQSAPSNAVEYLDVERVEKVMYIDNRVKGLHFTGLYIPKGETINIIIGPKFIAQKHKLVLNSDQEDEEIIELNQTSITKTVEKGSRVDIWVDGSITEFNAFEITITGCVEMPYYRLGIDRHEIQPIGDGFAVLDCANARFIMPSTMLYNINEIEDSLNWWRSCIEIMNRTIEAGLQSGDLAPINIYINDKYKVNVWEKDTKCIKMSESEFKNMMDFDLLALGSGEVLVDLLGELIASRANGYELGLLQESFGGVLSDIAFIVMTDNIKNGDKLNNANASEYLQSIINKTNPDTKAQQFFNVILHSFGIEKTIEVIKDYKYTMHSTKIGSGEENYIIACSDILGKDLTYFCEFLGYSISQEVKDACKEYPIFIPVATDYTTTGGETTIFKTGVVLPHGQVSTLNFNEAIVSTQEGWKVEELLGSESWEYVESGIYNYYPSEDRLEDNFTLKLVKDDNEVFLYGKISVNIKVATNSYYDNVSFKDLDKAIKGVKDIAPNKSFSVYKAQLLKEEDVDQTNYSLSKANGSLQVAEDGMYTLYLKSKGLTKVKFGVSEYMFDIFSNQLPVFEYIEELSYEIELEASKVYNFEIYVLSTQGDGWATLGIKDKDGNIVDIDEKYIVYQDMKRSSIVEYEAPVIDIDSFKIQQKGNEPHLRKHWNIVEKPTLASDSKEEYLFDGNKTTYYEISKPNKEFVIVLDMVQQFKSEYIELDTKVEMLGVNLKIETSSDNKEYKEIYNKPIRLIETQVLFQEPINCQYIRITLTKDKDFICSFSEIALGKVMKESIIIPNTSTKISYQGEWHELTNYASVNGSITVNNDKNSTIEYEFYGSMISVYSTKDKIFGVMTIYIDNKEVGAVDLFDTETKCAEQVYTKDFGEVGLHKIKLVPQGKKDMINLDYLTAIETERPKIEANKFNYWYMTIIPAVLIIALIGFGIADIKSKKNKKNQSTNIDKTSNKKEDN